jgi:hypothetical protein
MFMRTLLGAMMIAAAGCQATASAKVDAKSSGQVDADAEMQSHLAGKKMAAVSPADPADPSDNAAAREAPLGARAGVRLSKTTAQVCQCLRVFVGAPNDDHLTWEGPASRTNTATQLVVGLSSEALDCPKAAGDSLGASYQGYTVNGSDVIVQVETARLGRPIVQVAVVPRPPTGGRIIVRAGDSKTPYGRSADGKSSSCSVWTAP